MMIDVECQRHVQLAVGQAGVGLGALDEGYVFEAVLGSFQPGGGKEIVEDVFGDHMAAGPDRFAEVRQHEPHTGPDVGHRHARLQAHLADQEPRLLRLFALRIAQAGGHLLALFLGLVAAVGLACDLRRQTCGQRQS